MDNLEYLETYKDDQGKNRSTFRPVINGSRTSAYVTTFGLRLFTKPAYEPEMQPEPTEPEPFGPEDWAKIYGYGYEKDKKNRRNYPH